jgi:hypothetical protein
MPTQYYLPRNEMTYRFRYTKHNISFKHYVEQAPNFIVFCIAVLIDQQPLGWECRSLFDFLVILVEGVSNRGYGITAFFKEETLSGTLPEIVELIHYAHCLFSPSHLEIVTFKTHLTLFEHCSLIQYVNFLNQRWDMLILKKLETTSILLKSIK